MNHALMFVVLNLAIGVYFYPHSARAEIVTLGTTGNAFRWLITGAGTSATQSFQTNINRTGAISITSNAFSNGNFGSGGSLAAFNGFWFADTTFTIPVNANDVSLSFDSLYGNDRVVLQLNGANIGNATNTGTSGLGVMSFTSGVDAPFVFTNTTSATVTSGFVTGTNTLRLIVNNTGVASISAPTATFISSGDATTAFVNASVTYSVVPEPSAAILVIAGMVVFVRRRLNRSSQRDGLRCNTRQMEAIASRRSTYLSRSRESLQSRA